MVLGSFNLKRIGFILLFVLLASSCQNTSIETTQRVLPGGSMPAKLFVLHLPSEVSWHERNLLSCFQGLINRKETRIYYIESKQDQFWLNYYKETFNIQNEEISSVKELLNKFSKDIDGYITYNPENPHSLNIATTRGV